MAGKKKPVTTMTLADIGVEASVVGADAAKSVTRSANVRPPKEAGTVITDEGDGAAKIADFLASAKFI
jgi:electron transfer flavoprotein beta subunit